MQLLTAQIADNDLDHYIKRFAENTFLQIGFTHHITLINKCKNIRERIFYFQKTIENQWSVAVLEHHIESGLYHFKGKMINNFQKTLPENIQKYATDAFKS